MTRRALVLLLCACARPPEWEAAEENASTACGIERWSIKTAGDSAAIQIRSTSIAATISALTSLAVPDTLPEENRLDPTELTTFQLANVTLLKFVKETDSDYHLVLGDGTRTLIAEIPDPGCVSPQSPLAGAIAAARAAFDARHGPVSTVFTSVGETVTVSGVGFFDFSHGQTGVAPNGIELHPVTAICFGQNCAPAAPPQPKQQTGCATAEAAPWLALLVFRRRSTA